MTMTTALSEKSEPSIPSYGDVNEAVVPASGSGAEEATHLAHDTRNWLTTLRIYCDLLRTSGAVKTGYERWMEELSGSVERGQDLVASLLESLEMAEQKTGMVRRAKDAEPSGGAMRMPENIEAERNSGQATGDFPVERPSSSFPTLVDIGPALARRQLLWQRMADSNIRLEIDVPVSIGKATLAESAFERILTNLVQNAIEAMPGGGRLRISARRGCRPVRKSHGNVCPSQTLLLRVSDTGHGIAPEQRTRIFEAGVSGKDMSGKDRAKGLAGLRGYGLAIVRELTERAGGTVRVRSRVGRGSCFEVKLPCA